MTPNEAEQTKRLLTAEDVAQELGIGRTSAYALLWSAQIPSMKLGRLRRVRREDLDRFISQRMENAQ